MNRRSFFGLAFGALLAKFLPWRKPSAIPPIPEGRIDVMDLECWGVTQAENVFFDGPVVRAIDPTKPHSLTVSYRTRNGYWTAPGPVGSIRPIRMPQNISLLRRAGILD